MMSTGMTSRITCCSRVDHTHAHARRTWQSSRSISLHSTVIRLNPNDCCSPVVILTEREIAARRLSIHLIDMQLPDIGLRCLRARPTARSITPSALIRSLVSRCMSVWLLARDMGNKRLKCQPSNSTGKNGACSYRQDRAWCNSSECITRPTCLFRLGFSYLYCFSCSCLSQALSHFSELCTHQALGT